MNDQSLLKKSVKRFKAHRMAYLSLYFLCLLLLISTFAPFFTKFSYEEQNIAMRLATPSGTFWFGTDSLGRDLYSRVIYGARMSLAVGILTALSSLIVGTAAGAIAGYVGGWVDFVIMRVVDFFYIFPSVLLAILLTVVVGRGFFGIFIAISMTAWVTQARLVRSQVLQAREYPYVESARALGLRTLPILLKHILPNLWGPIIVSLTFQIPNNIMAESFLSFIGLGLQPPYSSWGTLANEGFRAMRSYPHLIIFPGTVLYVTLLAFNAIGDGLRDALDPKSLA